MTTIYIGGPITGHADLNKPAFDAAQVVLEKEGYTVFNPHTIPAPAAPLNLDSKGIWRYYMRLCVQHLTKCDELYMLAHWQNSEGAVWEHRIAYMLGMPIKYQEVT